MAHVVAESRSFGWDHAASLPPWPNLADEPLTKCRMLVARRLRDRDGGDRSLPLLDVNLEPRHLTPRVMPERAEEWAPRGAAAATYPIWFIDGTRL